MAQNSIVKYNDIQLAATEQDPRDCINVELASIKRCVDEVRLIFPALVNIRIDGSSTPLHGAIMQKRAGLESVFNKYFCMRESLDRIFQLYNPQLRLPLSEVDDVKQPLQRWTRIAADLLSKMHREMDENERLQGKIHSRYPLDRTKRKYNEAVGIGNQEEIDVWEARLAEAHMAELNLNAFKSYGDVLKGLEFLIAELLSLIPKLDCLALKDDGGQ